MSRFEAWCVHAGNLLVGGTGLAYASLRYLLEPADPYAVVNHPWQPLLQHLHVWTAPLLVFVAGLVWRDHVWSHLSRGLAGRRRSGLTMVANLLPMVASGYLIQTAVSPSWRTAWVAVHLAASGLWLAGYVAHLLTRRMGRREAAAVASRGRPFAASGGE